VGAGDLRVARPAGPEDGPTVAVGVPLIRLNPADSGLLGHGSFAALVMGERKALGKVEVTGMSPPGHARLTRLCAGASEWADSIASETGSACCLAPGNLRGGR
jgi:hypothetical protein